MPTTTHSELPCPNCHQPGRHFAPPSFGEEGFYTCTEPPHPARRDPNYYAAEHIIINGRDHFDRWKDRYFVSKEEYLKDVAEAREAGWRAGMATALSVATRKSQEPWKSDTAVREGERIAQAIRVRAQGRP